jgi:arylformamidase
MLLMEQTVKMGNKTYRIVDLSYKMYPGKMERYFEVEDFDVLGAEGVSKYHKGHKKTRSTESGKQQMAAVEGVRYFEQIVHLLDHVGTHIEMPLHYGGEWDCDTFPLEKLMLAPAAVVDVRHRVPAKPITRKDVRNVKTGDIALFYSGVVDKLMGPTEEGGMLEAWHASVENAPHLTQEVIDCLVEKKVVAVAADKWKGRCEYRRKDTGELVLNPTHQIWMKEHGIAIIESPANLHLLKKDRVLLTALPWPVPGLEACPLRLTALEEL